MSEVIANISLLLGKAALYGQPVVEQGHDIDLPSMPDITIVNGTSKILNLSEGYGYLYNYYAVMDERNLAPEGWRVAGKVGGREYQNMQNAYDDWRLNAGRVKSQRTHPDPHPRWNYPNEAGGWLPVTNETGFSALPGGIRTKSGDFQRLGEATFLWAVVDPSLMEAISLWNWFPAAYWYKNMGQSFEGSNQFIWNYGCSVRLVKESLDGYYDGMKVTDIDGNAYDTVAIPSKDTITGQESVQIWTAQNLAVSRFRNGDEIPNITSNNEWENTASAARCAYDNNVELVGGGAYPLVGKIKVTNAYLDRIVQINERIAIDDDEQIFLEQILI